MAVIRDHVKLPIPTLVSHTSSTETEDGIPQRPQWDSKVDFVLSLLGMSVGFGNIWRFPYLACIHGGATFLVPYIFILVVVGKPLYFAECIVGQFSSLSPILVYRQCCPAMKGVGLASTFISLIAAFYYNIFVVYSMLYLFLCFTAELPWSKCSESWGADENCYLRDTKPPLPWCSTMNSSNYTEGVDCRNWQSAGQQYWIKYVLNTGKEYGLTNLGEIQLKILITLLMSWTIIFLSVSHGIKSSGKVVRFTSTFPYVVLIMLTIVGLTLDGAFDGLYYLFYPNWEAIFDTTVWKVAAGQTFYSLNVAYGGVIMFSSFNKFTNKVKRDCILVTYVDFATSLLASVAVFSVLGNMSYRSKLPIKNVTESGPGLAYEIFPEALLILPIPQIWCGLFFLMLITLGIDSVFADFETFLTGIFDEFPNLRRHNVKVTFVACFSCFSAAIVFTTQGGFNVFDFIDIFGAGNNGIIVAFLEVITFMWIYGVNNFLDDAQFMLGTRPGLYWKLCWFYLIVPILFMMIVFAFLDFQSVDYLDQPFPLWIVIIGWCLTLFPFIQIPIWISYFMWTYHKRGLPMWKSFKPTEKWGPADPIIKQVYKNWKAQPLNEETGQRPAPPNLENL